MVTQDLERQIQRIRDLQRGPTTYYHYPSMKEPTWSWQVILYFYFGGLAAGSYLVATLVSLFGGPEDRPVARAGRYIALGAISVSPVMLILDLGRPERFTHMLRILKTRSPMSMGSWALVGMGIFAGFGTLRQAVEDGLIGRKSLVAQLFAWIPLTVSGVIGTLFAFFVASYTGVLLSFTNVPMWAKNSLLQGALFLTSALSTGLAAISLVLATTGNVAPATLRWLGRAEMTARLGEAALLGGTLVTLRGSGRPLYGWRYGLPFWAGAVGLGLVVPLAVRVSGERRSRDAANSRIAAASSAALVGGLIFRAVTVLAGRAQARASAPYLAFTGEHRGNGR